jgi:FixJ family two-component response regulator
MSDFKPTVFLVDDDASVLKALARVMRSAGLHVEAFASPQALLADYDPEAAGCIVLDVAMPGMNGLELQRLLAERSCTLPIVFLTGAGSIAMSVEAMKGGAADFLTKPVNDEDLLHAIHQAFERDRRARSERAAVAAIRQRLATLTPREHEVLVEVVRGRLNKQIAFDLGTVEKTIKVHRARVMEKMQVQSLAELVRIAERIGLVRD